MSTHFFTGGTMPSADLLLYFQESLSIEEQWWVNGKHYAKTCEVGRPFAFLFCQQMGADIEQDWLSRMASNKQQIWPHLEDTYGKNDAAMWYYRWQIFYLACAELFAYEGGDTWGVSHYLFCKS